MSAQNSTNYVQLPVPEERVAEVMAFLVDLERQDVAGAPPASSEDGLTLVLDANVVIRMYEESEGTHRRLLDYLAAHAGQWTFTGELSDALGVATGRKGMAGVFGAFGRRAKHRYGGAKPWDMAWDPIKGEAKYRVEPEVATWIREASS
jgi:hypothetical protein